MRRITVNANEVALVTKRGRLIRVLTEGRYWIGFRQIVSRYKLSTPVLINEDWVLMLDNDRLVDLMDVVEIADNQLGFEMKDGLYNRMLAPGKVAYWQSAVCYEVLKADLGTIEVSEEIPRYILHRPEVAKQLRVYPVESYQKGLLFIDGKYVRMLDPGVYYYWKSDRIVIVQTVDTRIRRLEIPGQEILTRDKAGIRINFSAQYQLEDVYKAVVETEDYVGQLYTALQLVLREYIGAMTLDQLLANKQEVGPYIIKATEEKASTLGVRLISGGIKDVILPGDMKDIMNQVLIAQKKAQANTIMRQEETASTRSLLNTAKLMDQNEMLMKLKEMEYMEKIAEKIGEITVNGGSQVMDQLRELVISK